MAKKFTFKGKTLEEVKAMPMEGFLQLIPSHQRRQLKRMNGRTRHFFEDIRRKKAKGKKVVKTHCRDAVILPEMLDMEFLVYNGKEWVKVVPGPSMLGHRLGEYSITTKIVKHSGPGIGATRGSKSVELK